MPQFAQILRKMRSARMLGALAILTVLGLAASQFGPAQAYADGRFLSWSEHGFGVLTCSR